MAREWRVRPLEYFGVEGQGAWTDTDRVLTEALAQYERSLCPDCKQPGWLAFDFDTNGWYEVKADCVCQACAAREQWAEEHKEQEPGQKITVVLDPEYKPKR